MKEYTVRFRVIRPEDYFTPMMHLPIETVIIETDEVIKNKHRFSALIGDKFNNNPDHIRVEEYWETKPGRVKNE